MKAFKNSNIFDGGHGFGGGSGVAAFMAWAAVQIPVFRDSWVEIISSNLVREDSSSNSRVTRANRNS